MRLVCIVCVKNEADLTEAFVRHHAALGMRVVILDNGSTDTTPDILRALITEGLPLEVVSDPSAGHNQWIRTTRLMREIAVAKLNADWIFPLDVDEFVMADGEELVPKDARLDRVLLVNWKTYVPDPTDNAAELNPVIRLRHRLVREAWPWKKVIVPSSLARLPQVSLVQGSHALICAGREVKGDPLEHMCLAHFPGRTPAQFAAKVAIKHLQYAAMADKCSHWGWHYKAAFAKLRKAPHCFETAFRDEVLRYAVDKKNEFQPETIESPFPYRGGKLRYTPDAAGAARLLTLVLSYAEQLAKHHAVAVGRVTELERLLVEHGVTVHAHDAAETTVVPKTALPEPRWLRALGCLWRKVVSGAQ